MFKNKFFQKTFFIYIGSIVIMTLISLIVADHFYRDWAINSNVSRLTQHLEHNFSHDTPQSICAEFARFYEVRNTLIDNSGSVICDSISGTTFDNHLNRDEIKNLQNITTTFSVRTSSTTHDPMLYVAKKLELNGEVFYLRSAIILKEFSKTVLWVWLFVFIFSLPVIILISAIMTNVLYHFNLKAEQNNKKFKEDLVANISHEIKTPLTSILGYSEILEEENASLTADQQDYVHRIIKSSKTLESLFNDILELSIVENKKEVVKERIHSKDLMNKILGDIEQRYCQKEICREDNIESFECNTDLKLLEMIIRNIVDNAYKYSPANSRIEIKFNCRSGIMFFVCRDSGPGISEEECERIFERFYRGSHNAPDIKGAGLGLAIVKHAVKSLGGQVYALSLKGQGSTFSVQIPIS